MELEKLQYPIGKWKPKKSYSEKEIQRNIAVIEKFPAKYKRLTKKLSDEELAKTYREGSWNVRQLVIHLSDMHILHFARFKQTLCVPNNQGFLANINGWADNKETLTAPVADGLLLLEATHKRWVHVMKNMSEEDFSKEFFHPLRQINLTLAQALHMSAWHTKHHFEHIKLALNS